MKKSSKKKNNFQLLIILIILVILICLISKYYKGRVTEYQNTLMPNIVNMSYQEVINLDSVKNLSIQVDYDYSDTVEKDHIISQSIESGKDILKGDKLVIVVSLGKLDKEKLKSDGINELGKVPIMMYHGIKNISSNETGYTGGNVDVDGYTRTAEAFRADLENYYQWGYRMVKLSDYINGKIDVEYGYSPIILTFDDGNDNNIKVTGLDENGDIVIDENSAVGILESFKEKYPDYNVTAIFFVTDALFNQPEYNEKILKWLVENGYEVGNHTKGHNNFSKINSYETQEVVGYMYDKLETILGDRYSKILALPFGSPYNKEHENYQYILKGTYNEEEYITESALRVGWEPELSPFNINFDKTFLKRCRAYDNNGQEFDITMNFNNLKNTRYISDGNIDTIVTSKNNQNIINETSNKNIILY